MTKRDVLTVEGLELHVLSFTRTNTEVSEFTITQFGGSKDAAASCTRSVSIYDTTALTIVSVAFMMQRGKDTLSTVTLLRGIETGGTLFSDYLVH